MDNENVVQEVQTQETEERMYSKEEVMALLQSEGDKRVQQALKTQQKKYEKQLSLSKLDDEAREKAMKDERIKELEEMLKDRDIANNKSEVKSVLSARGLSAEFADIIIIGEDPEENQRRLDAFDRLYKKSVTAEVERRLAASGGTPKGNTTHNSGEITKEQFRKMSLTEQAKLSRDFPDIYKKLTTN